jgi:hypothetical protein
LYFGARSRLPSYIKATYPLRTQEYSFFRCSSKFHTLVFFHRRGKKMRQTFVHTAEVVPALPHPSSPLYSPPFAQLAVGSRAQAEIHFVAIILHSIYYSSSITYKFILLPFSQRTAEGSITLRLSFFISNLI